MIIQSQSGALTRSTGGTPNNPGGTMGEALISELSPQYYTLLKQNKVFSIGAAAINPAAFVGAAAGTPAIGIYNPTASGIDIVMLFARLSVRTTGTAAITWNWNVWTVNQGGVAVTGTQSQAKNMYSQSLTGSGAYCMVNVANTAALAATGGGPIASFSGGLTAATAITNVVSLSENLYGSIVVPPGGYLAWGQSVAMTAGVMDCSLIWAELPV